jgi:hypothetical protein
MRRNRRRIHANAITQRILYRDEASASRPDTIHSSAATSPRSLA